MTISILEVANVGKVNDDNLCEDLYVISDKHVAVIDGATNVSGRLINGRTPGRLIAEVVQQTICEATADISLKSLIHLINEKIQLIYKELQIWEEIIENPWMTPTASIICYSHYYGEIWQVGDCHCLVNDQYYSNNKEVDRIIAEARALFIEGEVKRGKTIESLLVKDTSFTYVKELIQMQYYLQNDADNQYGFEVINGFDVDFTKVKIIRLVQEDDVIILASDGYPILKGALDSTEEKLGMILADDPLRFRKYKSTNGLHKGDVSFDDRTYIKFARSSQ